MSNIYIDPTINMNTIKEITIIIHFKTLPAHSALAIAKSSGQTDTLEMAEQKVQASHLTFQKDVDQILVQKGIPYTINHVYTTAFNGVSISLPANKILDLLESNEIAAIYANKEHKLDPPFLQL